MTSQLAVDRRRAELREIQDLRRRLNECTNPEEACDLRIALATLEGPANGPLPHT